MSRAGKNIVILTSMNLTLRQATEANLPEVLAILNYGIRNKLQRGDLAWGDTALNEAAIRPLLNDGSTYVALDSHKNIVGTFRLVWQDEQAWGVQPPVAGYLQHVAVTSGYRGQNIGGQMLHLADREIAAKNRYFLRLTCPSGNASLRAYYEKQDFVRADSHANPTYQTHQPLSYYERPVSEAARIAAPAVPKRKTSISSRFHHSRLYKVFRSSEE